MTNREGNAEGLEPDRGSEIDQRHASRPHRAAAGLQQLRHGRAHGQEQRPQVLVDDAIVFVLGNFGFAFHS